MKQGRDITRTREMEKKYKEFKLQSASYNREKFIFDLKNEEVLVKYKYWVIIPNSFPYDGVLQVHHMLVPKRFFSTSREMNEEERNELEQIKEGMDERYDGIFENFTHTRSVLAHYHLHLMLLRHYEN